MPAAGAGLPVEVDRRRVAQHLARERDDRRRQGRREEERLPLRRQVPQHALDVGQEAHVEHAVGLVEHEDLEALERRVGVAEVVEQAPGRRHDHVDARAERVLLRPHADAAEDGGARDRRVHGQLREVLVDLRAPARASGVRTSARVVRRGLRIRRCRIGSTKAAVLPLPVTAQASTSRPAIAGGIDCSWIGVGRVKPSSRTPRRSSGSRPKEEKGTIRARCAACASCGRASGGAARRGTRRSRRG